MEPVEGFQEYPKWRHHLSKGEKRINNADEEAELTPDVDGWGDLIRDLGQPAAQKISAEREAALAKLAADKKAFDKAQADELAKFDADAKAAAKAATKKSEPASAAASAASGEGSPAPTPAGKGKVGATD